MAFGLQCRGWFFLVLFLFSFSLSPFWGKTELLPSCKDEGVGGKRATALMCSSSLLRMACLSSVATGRDCSCCSASALVTGSWQPLRKGNINCDDFLTDLFLPLCLVYFLTALTVVHVPPLSLSAAFWHLTAIT